MKTLKSSMKLAALLFVIMAGNAGATRPQKTIPVVSISTVHPRFDLADRVRSQREKIKEFLANKTITADQAVVCRAVLNVVERRMKMEGVTKNPDSLPQKEYDAYNKTLDMNSVSLRESKQTYYYYDRDFRL